MPHDQEVIINDTVGFIRDLPPDLVNAFRATLEEIADSNLLIHLVDAGNPRCLQQIDAVERVLADLQFHQIPRLLVFNKTDLIDEQSRNGLQRQARCDDARLCVAVSAVQPNTLLPMLERAGAMLSRSLVDDAHLEPTRRRA